MLIGCAIYVDALKPPSLLSKALQENSMDIVLCLQNILHSKKPLKNLTDRDPLERPTVKLVLNRLTENKEYQGILLYQFNDKMRKVQAIADVRQLESKMRERLEWSDISLLRAIFLFLDTQTWHYVASKVEPETTPTDKTLSEILAASSSLEPNSKNHWRLCESVLLL